MPIQTSYTSEHIAGFEGQRATLEVTNIVSKVAEGGDIPFGRAVVQGTGDDQCKLPTATGQIFLGITEMTTAWSENSSDLHLYEQYREVNIIDFGEVYVYTEQSVVPGDAVYFRHTAAASPLDVVGRFRKDASGGDADLIQGAKFTTTTSAGGIAKVKLNAPGTGILIAPDSSETLSASGAISVDTGITYLDSSGGALAMTLADGVEGQFKRIMLSVGGNDAIITPANLDPGATLRLTEAYDYVDLQFSGTSWKPVGRGARATVTVVATSGALPLDADNIFFDTTAGASTSSLADGFVGQKVVLKMLVDGGNQVLTPANFADGTTLTFDDVGDSAELIFDGTNWGVIGTPTATVA